MLNFLYSVNYLLLYPLQKEYQSFDFLLSGANRLGFFGNAFSCWMQLSFVLNPSTKGYSVTIRARKVKPYSWTFGIYNQ